LDTDRWTGRQTATCGNALLRLTDCGHNESFREELQFVDKISRIKRDQIKYKQQLGRSEGNVFPQFSEHKSRCKGDEWRPYETLQEQFWILGL
jgi:hypothetical protein